MESKATAQSGIRYGYLRVSTGLDEKKQTLESQRYALLNDNVLPEHISEERISGSVPARQRPVLARLLSELKEGDSLIVYKLDRLARNMQEMLNLTQELRGRKVALVSVSEAMDTSTAIGELLFKILASFAEFERSLIRERVRDGIKARANKESNPWGRPKGSKVRSRLERGKLLLAEKERRGKSYAQCVDWASTVWPRAGGKRWHEVTLMR